MSCPECISSSCICHVLPCILRTGAGGCAVIPITSGYRSAAAQHSFPLLVPNPASAAHPRQRQCYITGPRREPPREVAPRSTHRRFAFEPTSRIDEPGACACMRARSASIRPSPCSSSPPACHFTSCRVLRRGQTVEIGLASPLSSRTHDSSATTRSPSRPTVPPVLTLPSSAPLFS